MHRSFGTTRRVMSKENGFLFFAVAILVFAIGCEKEEQKTRIPQNEIEQNRLKTMEAIKYSFDAKTDSQAVDIKLSPCSDCNKTDRYGKKQGLWMELGKNLNSEIYYYSETYYKDGVKNGVSKHYKLKKSNLRYFSLREFKDGNLTGNIYIFGGRGDNNGSAILAIYRNITENTDIIVKLQHGEDDEDCEEEKFPYKAYYEGYYPSGILNSEGIVLFYESPEEVHNFNYGTWKYYNEKGELMKTEDKPSVICSKHKGN